MGQIQETRNIDDVLVNIKKPSIVHRKKICSKMLRHPVLTFEEAIKSILELTIFRKYFFCFL